MGLSRALLVHLSLDGDVIDGDRGADGGLSGSS